MTGQDLKNSILQLAIQGKLVEQREEEGTAQELFAQIQEEKQKLIKEGKIKKTKALPEISEDEIPFEIPGSWKWVRLFDIINSDIGGGTPSKHNPSFWGGDIPWMSVKDYTKNPNGIISTIEKITEEGLNSSSSNLIPAGNVIVCTRVGLGKIAINNIEIAINQDLRALIFSDYVDKNYFIDFYNCLNIKGTGTTVKGIKREELLSFLVPLPPLKEQKRIVAKIEALMPYVEKYDQAQTKVVELNKKFPEDLQKSILQYAIQGKLVEQREEEGTAQELYGQIQEEKQRLIKEGKIKKAKALPEISEDEIPFEIPGSWKWVRLQEIGELSRGKSKHRPRNDNKLFNNGSFPLIQTGDVARANGIITSYNSMYNDFGVAQSRIWKKGTLCLTIAANIGDVALLGFDACFPDSVVGFNAFKPSYSNKYFMYGLMCYKDILDKMSRSTAQKNINIEILSKVAFPLPPLEEQERIVEKIEQILPYIKFLIK